MPLRVSVIQGSLTDGSELVLVNASNTNLILGSGVSGAIRRACGDDYQERIQSALKARFGGPMGPGDVLVTDAGAHGRAKWVAHVAVMDYRPGADVVRPTLDRIRTGCERLWDAIELIGAKGPLSVAMVALGAGVGGLSVRESTQIACETLKAHMAIHAQSRIERVVFYGLQLHELVEMAEVVTRHFPEAEAELPEAVRSQLRALRQS